MTFHLDTTKYAPYPPPPYPDIPPDAPFDERPRAHASGCGELGFALEKHLAGCPVNISEKDFIMWARIGDAPDAERRWALREALLNFSVDEIRKTLLDGRAGIRQICKLVVKVGGADSREWHDAIQISAPGLPLPDLPELDPIQEKLLDAEWL